MSTALMRTDAEGPDAILERANALSVYVSASESRLIRATGNKALMELSANERVERVGSMLPFIFRDLGITKGPTAYDGSRLLEYVELNHPRFTTADLKAAFEMYLAGRFDQQLPEDHKHFQQFSVAFYGKIFRRYVQHQAEAVHTVRHKVNRAVMLLQAPMEAQELIEHRSLSIIRAQVAAYLEHGHAFIPMIIFTHDWLVRLKICDPLDDPTKEEQIEALGRLKEKKGHAIAFGFALRRTLAGEKVDDAVLEAMHWKRQRALFRDIGNMGPMALSIIDAELRKLAYRAKAKGHDVNATAAA